MRFTPRSIGLAVAAVYGVLWLLSTYAYFATQNFDAMFALFVVSMPSSYFVNGLVDASSHMGLISEQLEAPLQYLGMLVLGILQYFLLGFVVAATLQRAVPKCVALFRRIIDNRA